ncbi:MAG: 5'-methylthioadenosine/adenosylhomocysteine nucleosidase [Eubacteriales bacterium]|nr:5'-methylthioadenosine/adenosylhomocysteine nucleosidase [Eubacteriales bacterium]
MKTGIIGAMAQEVEALTEGMESVTIREIAGRKFYVGRYHGCDVVVVESGIGKVNAAVTAQILIDRFEIRSLINTGIAGALSPRVNIGDVILSTDVAQYDVDVTAFGHAPGQIPGMAMRTWTASDFLREAAAGVQIGGGRIYAGRIITGDRFLADDTEKRHLYQLWQADCVEMEGAAIAQTASMNNIPFLVVRSISDKADGTADMDYDRFCGIASANSLAVINHLCNTNTI